MTPKEFIDAAIDGGWRKDDSMVSDRSGRYVRMIGDALYLDTTAWKAVASQIAGEYHCKRIKTHKCDSGCFSADRRMMHAFIDHLCDGLSVEEALTKATS